jgi:hypothetical protein
MLLLKPTLATLSLTAPKLNDVETLHQKKKVLFQCQSEFHKKAYRSTKLMLKPTKYKRLFLKL